MSSFADLGLSPGLQAAVADAGYTTPTPIQSQSIPVVITGKDVLGCAQTGTGKTASFSLPMIDRLSAGRARARMPRSLILEPTRELAAQVEVSFEKYGRGTRLTTALLVGGNSFVEQERKLDRGVDVLIATPGRLIDLIERGKILLSDVKILVIDEADRMLDMGFIPDVELIVSRLPKTRQTLFFSATMPPEIRRLADAFLTSPVEVSVAPPASPALTVTQGLIVVDHAEKRRALRQLIEIEDVGNAIIFCNRKKDVDVLAISLKKHGYDAVPLHGDLPQARRTETLERFKAGEIRILVASDVAARGLDVVGLSHVFNFDVPIHADDYVHRIGRTGRAGKQGRAFTIAVPDEGKQVEIIGKLIGRDIPRLVLEGIEQLELDMEGGKRDPRSRRPERKSAEAKSSGTKSDRKPSGRKPAERTRRTAPVVLADPILSEPAFPEPAFSEIETDEPIDMPTEIAPRRDTPSREASRHDAPRRPERRERTGHGASRPERGDTHADSRVTPLATRRRERYGKDDDDRAVIGFGDHQPAFLTLPRRAVGG